MKKFVRLILVLGIVSSISACGTGGNPLSVASLGEFQKDATIEPTVIYDENGVKITANELNYGNFSAELSITIENGTSDDLTFYSNAGWSAVNSINNRTVPGGYLAEEVGSQGELSHALEFSYEELKIHGITNIANMGITFEFYGDNTERVSTGPLLIETTASDSYDYSVNCYQEAMRGGVLENEFECTTEYFSDEILYDQYDVRLVSAAVVTNRDQDVTLFLEIENGSTEVVTSFVSDVKINDVTVYEGLWTALNINPGTNGLESIDLSKLVEKYDGTADLGTEKVTSVSFTFGLEDGWNEVGTKTVSVNIPEISIPTEEEN